MYIKIQHIKICGSDTTVKIWSLKHAYIFQNFNFLNTIMENKIKIILSKFCMHKNIKLHGSISYAEIDIC